MHVENLQKECAGLKEERLIAERGVPVCALYCGESVCLCVRVFFCIVGVVLNVQGEVRTQIFEC